jgi:tRNA U38,U39,U40 pseudouridine synthase TruA
VQYDGSKYYGFAAQENEDTVEDRLFQALVKLNLIEDRKVGCAFLRKSSFHSPVDMSLQPMWSNR